MLIFDFDGVMIDSLDEVTLSAYNTATGGLLTALEALPEGLVKLFQRNRFHVQPAGDQPLLMAWCLQHYHDDADRILSTAKYRSILAQNDTPLARRTAMFYEKRRQLIEFDQAAWLAVHRPFQPLWDALIHRGGQRVVVLTSKDSAALLRLCRHYRLEISSENVYSGDGGARKTGHLEQIHKRFGCERYDYIDDSLKNLQELAHAFNTDRRRIFPILAAWGYLGPGNEQDAIESGFRVYSQADVIRDLDRE